jgi:ketosteroid isomerase-like protein
MSTDIGPPEDIAAVREARAAIERSINDGDAEAFGTHLAENVAQIPAERPVHGRVDIVAQQGALFDAFDISEHFTIEQVVVVGDLAVEWGTYDLTVTDKATGGSMQGTALPYLYAYERDGDTWRVIRMSWEPVA